MNELMQVGQLDGKHEQSNRIYSEEGLCLTIMAGQRMTCTGGYVSPKILIKDGGVYMWKNELEKFEFEMEEIRVLDAFAGIGSLHNSLKDLGVPVRVTNLSEIDVDTIISYAGVHVEGFKDLEFDYPEDDVMKEWLIERNIGYSYEKNKSAIPRMRKDKLKLAYKASVLLNNLGDISMIDWDKVDDFDLMNLSFSCTDLSNSGKQKGMKNEDGTPTRSGLYVYGIKAVRVKKPKYIMIENVKGLIQKKFIDDFYSIISELEEIGYHCYYPTKEDKKKGLVPTCLNSKNFGISQNRERIFVFAVRNDIDDGQFEFNFGYDMGVRLKDMLEESVDEKYYLSDEIQQRYKPNDKKDVDNNGINVVGTSAPESRTIGQRDVTYGTNGIMSTLVATDYKQPKQIVENGAVRGRYNEDGKIEQKLELRNDGVTNTITTVEKDNVVVENNVNRLGGCFDTEKSTHQAGSVYDKEGVSPTLDTMQGGYRQPCIEVIGNLECKGWHDIETRVHGTDGISPTIECKNRGKYMDNPTYRIRKLTPLECWRLQGFKDEDFYRAKELGISDSQLYKQAGNSITSNVLYYQFKNLFKKYIKTVDKLNK